MNSNESFFRTEQHLTFSFSYKVIIYTFRLILHPFLKLKMAELSLIGELFL